MMASLSTHQKSGGLLRNVNHLDLSLDLQYIWLILLLSLLQFGLLLGDGAHRARYGKRKRLLDAKPC